MLDMRKFVSPEIIFGIGARKLAGRYACQFSANKAFLVSDQGVAAAGWMDETKNSLSEVGMPFHTFTDISPNPRAEEVMQGAEQYIDTGCDVIVAIGGGSAMDCAKGIGIVATHNQHITAFEGIDKISTPVPPLIFIPTTAGSSADVSQFCIISDQQRKVKFAIVSKALVPDVALIDPTTISTLSNYLTACTGIDALVHGIEAFLSTGSGPLTDMYALEAIKTSHRYLSDFIDQRESSELKEKIMLSSMQAGLAFSNASLGAVHGMAHSLGGWLDLPHGECNSLLLEHVLAFNFDERNNKYRELTKIFGLETSNLSAKESCRSLVHYIRDFKTNIGIPPGLRSKGVKTTDIPALTKNALADACMLTNPKKAVQRDIEVVFEEAM